MTVIPFAKPEAGELLQCSMCGVLDHWRACDCVGATYLRPGERVAVAVADPNNASKSSRALAIELGVGNSSVLRARNSVGSNEPIERVIGRGGRSYPARREAEPPRTVANIAIVNIKKINQASEDKIKAWLLEFKAFSKAEQKEAYQQFLYLTATGDLMK